MKTMKKKCEKIDDNSELVAIPEDTLVRMRSRGFWFNKDTFTSLTPHSAPNRGRIIAIVITKQRFDSIGGFHSMVMRHR